MSETCPELSIVIPCRDEQETIGAVIREAEAVIATLGIPAEIIVADNGSVDASRTIAIETSARIVDVARPGYGAALQAAIAETRGTFIMMGDADGSYDFNECARFLQGLRSGHALVIGCRLPSGGGSIHPGAMPRLHRTLGNPILSGLARTLFPIQVHDLYCGLRAFSRQHYQSLDINHTGMPFAFEMVIKFALAGYRISEIPVVLRPDGRLNQGSHLRTFRDGSATVGLIWDHWQQHRNGTLHLFRS